MTVFDGTQIFVGDIIKLEKNQMAPCDLLVVASREWLNGRYICNVLSQYDNGISQQETREAITITKPFNLYAEDDSTAQQFLSRFTGTINYKTNIGTDGIEGTIKLKSDPKIEVFSDKNIIKMGSVVMSARYVYGLVLYNGNDCFLKHPWYALGRLKFSKMMDRINGITIALVMFYFILSLLGSLMYTRVSTLEGSSRHHVISNVNILSHLSNYLSTLPVCINLMMGIFQFVAYNVLQIKYRGLLSKYRKQEVGKAKTDSSPPATRKGILAANQNWERRTELTPSTPGSTILQRFRNRASFTVFNPLVMADLGEIDDAFFDKTGTLTNNTYDIRSIATSFKVYQTRKINFINDDMKDKLNKIILVGNHSGSPAGRRKSIHEIAEEHHPSRGPRNIVYNPYKSYTYILNHDRKTLKSQNNAETTSGYRKSIFEVLNSHHRAGGNARRGNKTRISIGIGSAKQQVYSEKELCADYHDNKELQSIIMMFALCHSARPSNEQYSSKHVEETALLELVKVFGIEFEFEITSNPNGGFENGMGDYGIYNFKYLDGGRSQIKYHFKIHYDSRKMIDL